jgi:membrane protease YdiL (CAAX protease family)
MDKMKQPWRNILAIIIGLGPVYAYVMVSHITTGGSYTLKAMLLNPLVFGSATIVWIGFLYRSFCRKEWRRINRKRGGWWTDILGGIGLAAGLTFIWFLEQATLYRWLPRPAGNPAVMTLLGGLSRNPLLLAVWLGPVVWIGVAAFEEIQRAFTLDLLCDIASKRWQQGLILVFSSVLFGLAHLYQGPAGMVGTFVFAMGMGFYYLAAGRIWPLIIGHALYDSAQIVMGIMQLRRAGY